MVLPLSGGRQVVGNIDRLVVYLPKVLPVWDEVAVGILGVRGEPVRAAPVGVGDHVVVDDGVVGVPERSDRGVLNVDRAEVRRLLRVPPLGEGGDDRAAVLSRSLRCPSPSEPAEARVDDRDLGHHRLLRRRVPEAVGVGPCVAKGLEEGLRPAPVRDHVQELRPVRVDPDRVNGGVVETPVTLGGSGVGSVHRAAVRRPVLEGSRLGVPIDQSRIVRLPVQEVDVLLEVREELSCRPVDAVAMVVQRRLVPRRTAHLPSRRTGVALEVDRAAGLALHVGPRVDRDGVGEAPTDRRLSQRDRAAAGRIRRLGKVHEGDGQLVPNAVDLESKSTRRGCVGPFVVV